jgi:peptide/nickel transport system ATP-binding protein
VVIGTPIALLRRLTVDIATRPGRRAPVVRALTDANLTLHTGRVTGLIGESGCGKSLVAAALCGLLPPGSRVRGEIRYDGEDLAKADERTWRRLRGHRIALVPQSPATSFTPVRTLGAQLTEVCRVLTSARGPAELLEAVHLEPSSAALFPHELSGGMAQRAAIAAALAGRPAVLVADEPTSALDPDNAALVWRLLADTAATGVAVLVITHDLPSLLAAGGCHDIAVMRAGTVLAQQDTHEILSSTDDYVSRFFVGAHP